MIYINYMDEQENPSDIIIKSIIDKIITNIVKINCEEINSTIDSECPICFNELDMKKEQIVIYNCLHKYHRICLKNWILKTCASTKCMQCQCEKYIIINKPQQRHIHSNVSNKQTEIRNTEATNICKSCNIL